MEESTGTAKNEPDSYVEELLRSGPFQTRYISPNEASFKLAGLERWKWLWDALEKCPEGQCLLVDVPANHDCARMANCIRSAIVQAQKTKAWRWSVRQTKDEKGIVISRGERRGKLQDVLEEQREKQIREQTVRQVTRIANPKPDWDRTTDGQLDEPTVVIPVDEAILGSLRDDGPCTRTELIDRVEDLRAGTKRNVVYRRICQMLGKERVLHEDEQRLIHIAAIYQKGSIDAA